MIFYLAEITAQYILHVYMIHHYRNICALKWMGSHPHGTTAEFKEHFDSLQVSAKERKVSCPCE